MQSIFDYIANYGFPIVVASFLLVRVDKHLASLDRGIHDLNKILWQQFKNIFIPFIF